MMNKHPLLAPILAAAACVGGSAWLIVDRWHVDSPTSSAPDGHSPHDLSTSHVLPAVGGVPQRIRTATGDDTKLLNSPTSGSPEVVVRLIGQSFKVEVAPELSDLHLTTLTRHIERALNDNVRQKEQLSRRIAALSSVGASSTTLALKSVNYLELEMRCKLLEAQMGALFSGHYVALPAHEARQLYGDMVRKFRQVTIVLSGAIGNRNIAYVISDDPRTEYGAALAQHIRGLVSYSRRKENH